MNEIIDYSTEISTNKISSSLERDELLGYKNILTSGIVEIKMQYEDYKNLSVVAKATKKNWALSLKKARMIKGLLLSQIDLRLRELKPVKKEKWWKRFF